MPRGRKGEAGKAKCKFLTNHASVLICIAEDPDILLKDLAQRLGITDRAVQRLIADLEREGFLTRERNGRRNHYRLKRQALLPDPLVRRVTVARLLNTMRIGS